MRLRTLAFAVGIATLHSAANAWFFFIPVGAIAALAEGGHCVSASAKVGDRINIGGKDWTVKSTNGVSSRCSNTPQWPVIAKLEPYFSPEQMKEVVTMCLPPGASIGNKAMHPEFGEVYIQGVDVGGGCSDVRYPIQARVVRSNVGPTLAPGSAPAATPVSVTPAQPDPVVVREPRSLSDRLRELKQLRDENLISEAVYEAKQKEILAGQ